MEKVKIAASGGALIGAFMLGEVWAQHRLRGRDWEQRVQQERVRLGEQEERQRQFDIKLKAKGDARREKLALKRKMKEEKHEITRHHMLWGKQLFDLHCTPKHSGAPFPGVIETGIAIMASGTVPAIRPSTPVSTSGKTSPRTVKQIAVVEETLGQPESRRSSSCE